MSSFTWQNPWAFAALLLVPALVLLFRHAQGKRDALLRAYGGQRTAELASRGRERRRGHWCVVAAAALLVLALARPGANPHHRSTPEGGRDLVFLLDVSRSMLADDVRPSRLERAKEDIARCVASLEGDRVGLIVFAGAAAIRCPLTTDYDFFRLRLQESAPDSAPHGSTYLQSALEKTADRMLSPGRAGLEDVILLTDGEDQGSHPEKALEALNTARARLMVVGYGDPTVGARIPEGEAGTDGFMMHGDREVWTRLQAPALQSLAAAGTHGDYVRGGTPGFDLGRVYQRWSADAPRRFLHGRGDMVYDEYYAWLLFPALLLLLYPFPRWPRREAAALLAAWFVLAPCHAAVSADALDRLRTEVAAETDPVRHSEKTLLLGVVLMNNEVFDEALKAFQSASNGAATPGSAAACRFNEALAGASLAAKTDDPAAQADLLDAAVSAMRRARLLRADWAEAAQSLEVLYVRRAAALEALKERQEQQDQMNKEVQALLDELRRLLEGQGTLFADGDRLQSEKSLAAEQALEQAKLLRGRQMELGRQTATAQTTMAALRDRMRGLIVQILKDDPTATSLDKVPTAFDEPLTHVQRAHDAQENAADLFGPPDQLKPAVQAQQRAVQELEAALKALNDQNNQGDPESDSSEGDESSDSDNAPDQSAPLQGDLLSDPVNRALPRPSFSAEDIMQEEQANAQTRAKNKPARVGEGEKDW